MRTDCWHNLFDKFDFLFCFLFFCFFSSYRLVLPKLCKERIVPFKWPLLHLYFRNDYNPAETKKKMVSCKQNGVPVPSMKRHRCLQVLPGLSVSWSPLLSVAPPMDAYFTSGDSRDIGAVGRNHWELRGEARRSALCLATRTVGEGSILLGILNIECLVDGWSMLRNSA